MDCGLTYIDWQTQVKAQNQSVFIGIDNFDSSLWTCLTIFSSRTDKPAHLQTVARFLQKILKAFVAQNSKLLVVGHLPILRTGLKDIPNNHAVEAAFGISDEEMKGMFTVIAGNGREMDRTTMRGLEEKPIRPDSHHRCYNFNLFLHYMATTFDQYNNHARPGDSPLLQSINEHQQDLLLYLRRTREVAMAPKTLRSFPMDKLPHILRDKEVIWWILYRMGALEFGRVKTNTQWSLYLTKNPIIRGQVRLCFPPYMFVVLTWHLNSFSKTFRRHLHPK